jgi:16S rRNA (uracil1498-N3)-methyltransferase
MTIPRVYVSIDLQTGTTILLDEVASNHVLRALRLNIDDIVFLFNGKKVGEFQARIIEIIGQRGKIAKVLLEQFYERNTESPFAIHVGQGIGRGEKMDYVVQKSVELGAASITPLITEFCNVRLEGERLHNRFKHWQAVAIAACEQCGRCLVPKVITEQNLQSWLSAHVDDTLKLVLDPRATFGISNVIPEDPDCTDVALLVGPEGGLSEAEVNLAVQHGFKAVRLGPRILRTETAALVALSVLQSKWW